MAGNEGSKCYYNTRLDTYGCGCAHDCHYCYAKSLLNFRHLWDANNPRKANISKIEKVLSKVPPGSIIRLGGMSDCFQPVEIRERITLETIRLLNKFKIRYLIVTKSHLVAHPDYMSVIDSELAHIQISVTCLDSAKSSSYEKASSPGKRIAAILELQERGYDVALRLSPLLDEYLDFRQLNGLSVKKVIVEFLRVNTWIRQWFPNIDYDGYTLRQSNYYHLPLETKRQILGKIKLPQISVCEDVSEHYEYWKHSFNPNPNDCCNLRNGIDT